MAETTGENFGTNIPGVRAESALNVGGSRVVNAEKLSRAWRDGQNEMIAPIADLLSGLVSSGQLREETLAEALRKAHGPVNRARREGESAETQVARSVSERFISILALRLSGGDAEKAKQMLGKDAAPSGGLDADVDSLAKFVTLEARNRVKK